eukprot:8568927-Pyramimonas_sp.AAC.1
MLDQTLRHERRVARGAGRVRRAFDSAQNMPAIERGPYPRAPFDSNKLALEAPRSARSREALLEPSP